MGASGPPGGFVEQKYLRTGQYAPQAQSPHPPASTAFYSPQAPSSYPPSSFPSNTSVPPKSSSFPPLPGGATMFNVSPVPQGPLPTLNPYYFARDHGLPISGYPPGPPTPQQADFSQGGTNPLHPSPTTTTAPVAALSQDRGVAPVSSSPLDGARLMALLTTQSVAAGGNEDEVSTVLSDPEVSASEGKYAAVKPPPLSNAVTNNLVPAPLPKTLQDSKLPRGRVLKGERIIYDVDVRKPEEAQPQLEVRAITTYGSDPEPILGRQIAVNMDYICYGLRGATIRIINLTAELRALLRGHSNRVTDMAFAAENVNRLASVSTDGRLFVRHIMESHAADGKYLIQEHIVAAIQFLGNWESTSPRICWKKQDVLLVAVGKYILSIDLNKVQKAAPHGGFTIEKPVLCNMKDLLEGISKIGEHEEDVTDLAIPSYPSNHIASASADGLVRVWGQNKSSYLSSFAPHMGDVVGAVAFLSAPAGFPEHSILLTAGYQMNRELKLWAPEETASPSKSGNIMWECIQTVEFQSSAAGDDVDSAFFNQVAVAPQANLIVVANAKKNAIYVLHVQFGSRPERAQLNYLAEFSVTIPILSLTVKEQRGSEGGQRAAVQIYCVQTAAIQQYSLLVSQCLPMPTEKPVKQASPVVDKLAVKVVTATPGPSPQASVEKIAPNLNAPNTDATSAPGLAPNVPPGYERIPAAYENLLEGGQPMTEMAKLIATTKLSATEMAATLADGSKNPASATSNPTLTGTVKGAQVPSSPVDKSVSKYEAEKIAIQEQLSVPPLKILSRSKSPLKSAEQRYVPASTGLSKSNAENLEENRHRPDLNYSPGGQRREPSATTVELSNIKVNIPRSGVLVRQASGNLEKEGEHRDKSDSSSGLRKPQSENRGEAGVIEVPTQTAASSLGGTSAFSSIDSGTHSSVEDEEQRGAFNSFSTGVHSNAQSHHLITPKELMSLVDGSRPPQASSTKSEGDISGVVETRVGAEIEAVQLETVNFPVPAGAHSNTSKESDASKNLHASFESNEQELLSQADGPPSREYGSTEYGQSDFNPADDEGLMDSTVDDGMDHSHERNFQLGDTGGESGASSQASVVTKQRKNKNKTSGVMGSPASGLLPALSSLSPGIVPESEATGSWNSGFSEAGLAAQVASMQESINQLVNMQMELQKQMTVMVSVPVVKEGKRLEVAMGLRMEKVLKAHVDAMWARVAEENAKRDKIERDRLQQITSMLNNFFKEMPAVIERGMKKEFSALIPTISQAILPPIQKAISTGISESFQKGVAEKLLPQLEKMILGKLEVSISRQLQTQFQTLGKVALQDAIRISFDGYIIPTFENSCRTMFEHVDSVFKHGMEEHVVIAQQQFSSMHSPLASTLQETVTSASALAQSLKGELAESNKRLAALVESSSLGEAVGSNRNESTGFLEKILSLQHVEETIDPTVKLAKLLKEDKLEEAFHMALSAGDVDVVTWLCNQIDPMVVFQRSPLPLGQGILLSLVQQLGVEIEKDTKGKLRWIQEAVLALNPKDPTVSGHIRAILEQVLSSLHRQTNLAGPGDLSNQMRLVTHVVNSMLTACK